MAVKKGQDYYLGLDIGTDSVGYAATAPDYRLLKYRGEPMWGVMTFEEGHNAAERRSFRTARRRLERRKQRLALLQELFAEEIGKIDPEFFLRQRESMLFPDDRTHGVEIFRGGKLTDKEYHQKYPTIHHLIFELMSDPQEHDVRLLYLACSWLVSHRGHFLFDIDPKNTEKLLDFSEHYFNLFRFLDSRELPHPWADTVDSSLISGIMQMQTGVSGKKSSVQGTGLWWKIHPERDRRGLVYPGSCDHTSIRRKSEAVAGLSGDRNRGIRLSSERR